MRIGLNGRFRLAPMTGVQRFAHEVASRLVARAEVREFRPPAWGAFQSARHLAWEQLRLPWLTRAAGCQVTLHLANAGAVLGGPHVMVLHDVTPLTHPEWYTRRFVRWWRIVVATAARRAARLVVVSRWTADTVRSALEIPDERLTVVTQGVAPFDAPLDRQHVVPILRRFQIETPYVLTSGGWAPRKNLGFLAEVIARLCRTGIEVRLVVVGATNPRLQARAVRPEGAHLQFVGEVTDAELHALYTGASAFAFASLAEGFGRPPLEAMGCGTPAVVAPYGPARDVLGEDAVHVPLDEQAWAEALGRLLTDPEERCRWSARGQRRASSYGWADAVEGVLAACRAAAKGP